MEAKMIDKDQCTLFSQNTIQHVTINNQACIPCEPPSSEGTNPITVNTNSGLLKTWMNKTSEEIRLAENLPNYGASSLGREAMVLLYKLLHDGNVSRRHKLNKHMRAVIALLDNLP